MIEIIGLVIIAIALVVMLTIGINEAAKGRKALEAIDKRLQAQNDILQDIRHKVNSK